MADRRRLRLLLLEDSDIDADLARSRLTAAGLDFELVHAPAREAYVDALAAGTFDAILADFNLPDIDGFEALELAASHAPLVPFLFVSGRFGEEVAVEALKRGAADYVLKQRLERLAPALERAIGEAAVLAQERRAEIAVRSSDERTRLALQAGRMATWERNLVSDLMTWSEEARAVFLFAPDALPATFADFLTCVHTEDRETLESAIAQAADGLPHFTADFRYFRPDGEPRWIQASGRVIDGGNGERHVVAVSADVTERRFADEHLRRVQRMEAMARIAGGVAHEANNQMTVVEGFADFILRRTDLDQELRADVEQIRHAAQRTAGIVQQLLAFSRRQVSKPETLHLTELLTVTIPVLQRALGEGQRVETEFSSSCCVCVDRAQFSQVLLNLAFNARDAMSPDGVLRVSTRDLEMPEGGPAPGAAYVVRPGKYVVLQVSDDGAGMPPDVLERIFEPFFTTKAVGAGTGLGLASVYGIIKQAGGYVRVSSEVGVGSTFEILLPHADAASESDSSDGLPERGGEESVLIVEDEPAVRRTTARTLRDAGYTVIEAGSADEAMESVKAQGSELSLVITDLAMPGPDGKSFADELRILLPDLPVLFISGYAREVMQPRLSRDRRFLSKPFAPSRLRAIVREMLDVRREAMPVRR